MQSVLKFPNFCRPPEGGQIVWDWSISGEQSLSRGGTTLPETEHKTFLSELAYNHWMDWGHTPKFLLFLYPLDRVAKIEAVLHFSDTASSWVAKEKLN